MIVQNSSDECRVLLTTLQQFPHVVAEVPPELRNQEVDSHLSGCDDVQVEVVTRVPLIAKRVATTLDIDCAISSVESARSNRQTLG